jgi:hypothetical protein
MKHYARLISSVLIAASILLSGTVLFSSAIHRVSTTHAAKGTVTGSIGSSPSSGPVGATVAVNGSGWSEQDGTQVYFGYLIGSFCTIVPDAQIGTISAGAFSGWFRWPDGMPLGTYTVCANIENTTATANTYTLLSVSAPQIALSATTLVENQQVTITGSNYFPEGSTVVLAWQAMNGNIDFSINPAISASDGTFSSVFTVPITTLPGGSYMIVATVGGGQPPTLSSSATFTYNAPVHNTSPTPSPKPDPTPTTKPSPTAIATIGVTPTATTMPTSTTPVVTQNPGSGQTPTTNTTTNTTGIADNTSNTSGTTTPDQSSNEFQIAGIVGALVLLFVILAIVLLVKRRRASTKTKMAEANPSVTPAMTGTPPWVLPSNNAFAMPVYAGQVPLSVINSSPSVGKQAGPYSTIEPSSYRQVLQPLAEASAGPGVNDPLPDLHDPALEAIKRQAQMGLFAAPKLRRDERV